MSFVGGEMVEIDSSFDLIKGYTGLESILLSMPMRGFMRLHILQLYLS